MNRLALILFTVIALNGCTPKMTFAPSTTAPAATGTIKVKKDKNNNYVMDVSVLNLAEPKNLTPSKNLYLVWVEANDNTVKKIGRLSPSGKALKGDLKATSTTKPNDVFITAEDNVEINYPAGQTVLTTKK